MKRSDLFTLKSGLRLAVSLAVMTGFVHGCGIFYNNDHSVRLRSDNLRDTGLLPRIPETRPYSPSEVAKAGVDGGDFWVLQENREGSIVEAWQAARNALLRGDFDAGERKLHETLQLTEGVNRPDGPEQPLRNAVFDLLDALTARRQGVTPDELIEYARLRYSIVDDSHLQDMTPRHPESFDPDAEETAPKSELWKLSGEERAKRLAEFKPGNALEDNVAYMKTALKFRDKEYPAAETEFLDFVRRFPQSEKRAAAEFMIGVSVLHQAAWFDSTERLAEPDAVWRKAHDWFTALLRKNPKGRYADDARGWLAFLDRRVGNRAAALAEYYRLLLSPIENTRYRAAHSLSNVGFWSTDAETIEVERLLANEPAVARVYLYYELFNNFPEIDRMVFGDPESCSGNAVTDLKRKEERIAAIRRLSDFSKKLGTGGDPVFILRSAMAAFVGKDDRAAADLAKRSLEKGLSGIERQRALWVAGAAELRLKEYKAAVAHFERLLAEHPDPDFEERTRRQLAITAEEMGDFDTALDQYFALDYDFDTAYLIDVLMTPDQLRGYIDRHPFHPQINTLRYSLGVRYLRDERLDLARAALMLVHVEGDPIYSFQSEDNGWLRGRRYKLGPEQEEYRKEISATAISSRWVAYDLQTIEALEDFRKREKAAWTREERAEVRYQTAGFLYQSGQFLFYNPAIWGGFRYNHLFVAHSSEHYRAPGEEEKLWRYQQDHENVSRALKVFLSVVDDYPDSEVAPHALYTAAVCHDKLSSYNEYWVVNYNAGHVAWSRPVTYADVKRTFPKYVFPRGTNGWEPMSRTVNGHAAWLPKPKPVPPKPFHVRAWAKAEKGWGLVSPPLALGWNWTTGLIATVFGFVFRLDVFIYLAGLTFAAWFFGFRAHRKFIARLHGVPVGNEPAAPEFLQPDFSLSTALGLTYLRHPLEIRDELACRLTYTARYFGWWIRTRQGVTILSHAMLHGGFAASLWWLCHLFWR